jgi:hypothetical protein
MDIITAEIPKVPKVLVRPAHMVDQAEPNSFFHPGLQCLQHALCPHRTFYPIPSLRAGVSCLPSPYGHCRRSLFVRCGLHASTFLHPFAPGELPPFPAPMDALTPARPVLRLTVQTERRPSNGQVSLVHLTQASLHSVTKHLTRPVIAFLLPAQRGRLPGTPSTVLPGTFPSLDFPLNPKGRRIRTAESCSSLSYGLHVHLGLLSTPSHDGAVTFSYRERASPGRGLSPLRLRLLPGARIPAFAGMTLLSSCDSDKSQNPIIAAPGAREICRKNHEIAHQVWMKELLTGFFMLKISALPPDTAAHMPCRQSRHGGP